MGDSLSFSLNAPPDALLHKARLRLKKHGGTLDGNTAGGTFTVRGVHGDYTIQASTLTVTISKKPLFIPMRLIESVVRGQFRELCEGGTGAAS